MNCIVKSLVSDVEKLQRWIKNLSPSEAAALHAAITTSGVRIPPEAFELLVARME